MNKKGLLNIIILPDYKTVDSMASAVSNIGISRSTHNAKFLQKCMEKSLEIWVRKKVGILTKIVRQFWKFWKNYVKFEFLSQKNLLLGQKVWKKKLLLVLRLYIATYPDYGDRCTKPLYSDLSGRWRPLVLLQFSETGLSEHSEIVLFQNFQKLRNKCC